MRHRQSTRSSRLRFSAASLRGLTGHQTAPARAIPNTQENATGSLADRMATLSPGRNQSLFDASFRAEVHEIDQSLEQMIWRVVSRYAELAGTPPAVPASVAYAIFDGLFQQALLQQVTEPGSAREAERVTEQPGAAAARLQESAASVLESLITARCCGTACEPVKPGW
jgi:hypothetical protein